ncbi:FAD-dependent oxidoreductase [Microbulbifer sp. MKSA007]|nr:FAD-dependent oxidoreductase [Microbulbifer sp. MKSA007]
MQEHPNYQDILLVGGGHSHAIVLQMWAMNPLPGARLTLVSPQVQTAYSGMLPGMVAGHYSLEDTHIDLARLCRAAGARFIQACAHEIDIDNRTVSLLGRPPVEYDLLSLDVGATPARELPGSELAIPVKPIGHFYRFWQKLQKQVGENTSPFRLGVVGGGAGGCELSMAMAHALQDAVKKKQVEVHLIHGAAAIPQGYPIRARKLISKEMQELGVQLHHNWTVNEITEQGVVNGSGDCLPLDQVILTTNACAPPGWPTRACPSMTKALWWWIKHSAPRGGKTFLQLVMWPVSLQNLYPRLGFTPFARGLFYFTICAPP